MNSQQCFILPEGRSRPAAPILPCQHYGNYHSMIRLLLGDTGIRMAIQDAVELNDKLIRSIDGCPWKERGTLECDEGSAAMQADSSRPQPEPVLVTDRTSFCHITDPLLHSAAETKDQQGTSHRSVGPTANMSED